MVNARVVLSAFATGMVIVHSPPLLRRLGVRSEAEIEAERNALRALRGDFATAKGTRTS